MVTIGWDVSAGHCVAVLNKDLELFLLPGPPAARDAVWIMNRCGIGREPRILNVNKEGLTGKILLRPILLGPHTT